MANGIFGGGNGTQGNPYLIEDAHDFNAIRTLVEGATLANMPYCELVNDIDMGVHPYNTGLGWQPIGSSGALGRVTLDGRNNKIKNLYINRPSENPVGLFGYLTLGNLSNVIIVESNVTGGSYTGSLSGRIQGGTVTNCFVSNGDVASGSYAGGLFGLSNASLKYCAFNGKVKGTTRVGGLVGQANNDISNSYAICTKVEGTSKDNTGGMIGYIQSANTTLSNCFCVTDVLIPNNANGFGNADFGSYTGITFTNCYYDVTKQPNATLLANTGTAQTTSSMSGETLYATFDKDEFSFGSSYPRLSYTLKRGILINHNNTYKVFSGGVWVTVTTAEPTAFDYINNGMSDISAITESAWGGLEGNYDIMYWTENLEALSPTYQVNLTPFKPILKLAPSTARVAMWTNEPDSDELKKDFTIEGIKKIPIKYKVELVNPPTVLKDWAETYDPVDESVILNSSYITAINPYNIKVTAVNDATGYSESKVGTVTLYDTEPTLICTMTGMRLDVSIGDPENDRVKFRVVLNGRQIHPTDLSKAFTELTEPLVTFTRLLRSNEVNIGANNTIQIIAQDEFGKESNVTLNFIGEYVGLMFSDEFGDYYSDDLGNVLQYLDVGILVAGQVSETYPIRLINKSGYTVTNIELWRDRKTLPSSADVEISGTDAPFVSTELLSFNTPLNYADEVTFYVRIVTQINGQPGQGDFDVFVKADPA